MDEISDIEALARRGDAKAQVQLADRLDAEGKAAEAGEWLRRAAALGEPDAMAAIAIRRLDGRRPGFSPQAGLPLLMDAYERGSGRAARMLAVLAATGNGFEQSWSKAIEFLTAALALREPNAMREHFLLDKLEFADPSCWTPRAADVEVVPLTDAPRIETLRRFLPGLFCRHLMQAAKPRLGRARVYGQDGQSISDSRSNTAAEFGLTDLDLVLVWTQLRIAKVLGVDYFQLEAPNILHYEAGEKFDPHFDFLDPAIPANAADIAARGQRAQTFLVYLNDGYEGGETEFPELGLKLKGDAGDGLAFWSLTAEGAPDRRTLHAGRPPTSGEKYVLSQWARTKAPLV